MAVVLENSGLVEPERIESYIAAGGYQALLPRAPRDDARRRSSRRSPAAACAAGAGRATRPGVKWGMVAKQPAERKFVVCNADEGDPGAFMDRSVLESDPHRVLEGMAIAAYAVGANQGYIYVRGEYPAGDPPAGDGHQAGQAARPARQPDLRVALRLPDRHPHRRRRLRLRRGDGADRLDRGPARHAPAAAAVPGRGGPVGLPDADQQRRDLRQRARRSSASGADWFAGIGTEKSKGTKVFALAGKVKNTGLVEVPMGTTLRQIVEEIGGGVARRRHDQGGADRRPLRRLHPGRACSTRPSITSRWRSSARSWAPAA